MRYRFVSAWHRAQRGLRVRESHTPFLDLLTLLATLSPRRLELLRHVRQHGAESSRALATARRRDYRNVYQDVAALEAAGLLLREGRALSAPWDEVQVRVNLTEVAPAGQ